MIEKPISETVRTDGQDQAKRPRLGFVGVGWIGRNRMEAVVKSGLAEAAAIADPSRETALSARTVAPEAVVYESLDALLEQNLDGIVIATPSALHAEQAIRALEAGFAVFCQKPLGRTSVETLEVIRTAERTGLLLGVDLSYRHIDGMARVRDLVRSGALGEIYAAELTFHNAYGPDKAWFYDQEQSGGGCVLDLGIHLLDLLFWTLENQAVAEVSSRLFHRGKPLPAASRTEVEDYAVARIDLASGTAVNLAVSWNLPAGREAVIRAVFYGTKGGAELCNIDGSFYRFSAHRFSGTSSEPLAEPTETWNDWGVGAVTAWAGRLASSAGFDPGILELSKVSETIDRIYGR